MPDYQPAHDLSPLAAALTDAHGPAPHAVPARPAPRPSAVPTTTPAEGAFVDVLVDDVHPSPENPRIDAGDLTDLMASMTEVGLIQPVIVRRTPTGELVIVAGHRRHEAARRLGWRRVEVIVRKDMAPDDELTRMLIENGHRAGLDPIEEARALARLKALGHLSDVALAKKVGRSQPTVSSRLALLSLPIEEQEQLRAGRLSVAAGAEMGRMAAGKVAKTGVSRDWHFGPRHDLSNLAAARCRRLKHKTGRIVGGMACGQCWESVIRADERRGYQDRHVTTGVCPVCGGDAA